MESILFGVLAALCVIIAFIAGAVFCKVFSGRKPITVTPAYMDIPMTEEEKEIQEKKRRELIDQQAAFQSMQNYSAEMAYGVSNDSFGK